MGGRGEPHCEAWNNMLILASGDGPHVGQLEKDVIKHYKEELPWCLNKGPGGERCAQRGTQEFLYCVYNSPQHLGLTDRELEALLE